ncbi:MAG TPA: nucleotide exchange factor GrpE [Gammaproteobacteria bacterium]
MTEEEAAADNSRQDDPSADEGSVDGVVELETGADEGVDQIETLKAEAQENWQKYLRSVAEIENLRKRNARDVENARRYGTESLVAAILPVRDSLEAGLKAATEAAAEALDIDSLIEGEQATLRLLDQALESAGVVEIDPEGEPFDPEQHEAMSMVPSPTAEPNSVLAVVQKGFALQGRIVRPARVIVARAPTDSDP